MNFHYKQLLIISLFIFPLTISAQGEYTKIGNVQLYSEYYPNPHASFKGTLVFESGSDTSLTEWTQNKTFFYCARQAGNLFLYDRNGLGKSPPDLSLSIEKPMTAKLINSKLMQLLEKRHIPPPYILIAHSYGGLYAGYFARKYPTLVKGMVMVDPVPNNYEWTETFLKQYSVAMKQMSQLSSQELYSQYSSANADKLNLLSAELFYQLKGFEETKAQVNQLPPLSSAIPIVIISSSYMEKNAPIKGDWYSQQQQWLNDNSNSKIIKISSGHYVQLEHPQFVCDQIKTVIGSIDRQQ